MAEDTKIEWTDATWSPITGCSVVSPGCQNCYAMTLAASRLRNHPSRAGLTNKHGKWNGQVRFNEGWLDQPLRWRRPRRIFVVAHGDLFHENVPDEWIDKVFAVMALAPRHQFQVLTKRAERMRGYIRAPGLYKRILRTANGIRVQHWKLGLSGIPISDPCAHASFWPHVWLGVSVEDQERADERIPLLLSTPAAVRFVSAEPLLGGLELTRIAVGKFAYVNALYGVAYGRLAAAGVPPVTNSLDWVIVGGESGPKARPMNPQWARDIRDQCVAAGVAFHFKQWGEWLPSFPEFDHDPEFADGFDVPLDWRNRSGFRCINGRGVQVSGYGGENEYFFKRLGKKRAGRLLDGREWNGMPA